MKNRGYNMKKELDFERIALAVYENPNRKQAAGRLGVTERTLYTYLQNCEVQAALKLLRYTAMDERRKALAECESAAIQTICAVMQSDTASNADKLRAAGMILQFGRDAAKDAESIETDALEAIQGAERKEGERNGVVFFP